MKSVVFETRKCSRDGGSASCASLGGETIAYLEVKRVLRCCCSHATPPINDVTNRSNGIPANKKYLEAKAQ